MIRAPGRLLRNVSLASRLSFMVVTVALVSVVFTSLVGLRRGRDLADDVVEERIAAIAIARGDEVERFVAGVQRAVVGQAISPRSASALDDFTDAYRILDAAQPTRADRQAVEEYYDTTVVSTLSDARDRPVNSVTVVPNSNAAITLQAAYVVPDGDDSSGRMAPYVAVHDSLQPSFEEFVLRNGIDDFYLISADNNTVVYSTDKAIDFGTSLRSGPHSGSALAALVSSMSKGGERGEADVRDFGMYAPTGDRPAMFIGSPVLDDGQVVGYVAVRVGHENLTSIMTNDGDWSELGDTGEAYLVAADGFMRSDARGFIEDESAYLEAVESAGSATADEQRLMQAMGTTTLFQPVDPGFVSDIFGAGSAIAKTDNHLGAAVLSANRRLTVDDVDWAVVADVEIDEVDQPLDEFVRNLLVAVAVFIVVVTFLAVRWSDRLLEPLRVIASRLRAIRDGLDTAAGKTVLPAHSASEFVELGGDIDTMLVTLRKRNAAAALRAGERRRLLRRLLPPAIAERAEAGDRDVVEQVPTATVAVVVIGGLGAVMRERSPDEARAILDRVVAEADDLAAERGLDRLRLTGDAYVAACGITRLHLDHASRAVAFVLDVVELIDDLDADGRVTVSAGVDSGPVTVALTGGDRLVHETWGSTVVGAGDLARRARPGEILVSAAVRAQLPDHVLVDDRDADVASGAGVGRVRAIESGDDSMRADSRRDGVPT